MTDVGLYNIVLHQGETFSLSITYKDENDNPVSLVGYTGKMHVRTRPGGSSILSLASGSGITITGATGEIAISVTAAQSALLPAGVYQYDLALISATSTVTYLLRGTFTINPRITQT